MSYRTFYITNGKGVTKQLAQESSKIFLNNPSGLGYSNTIGTTQYSDTLVSTAEQEFPTIEGEFVFFDDKNGDKYDKYNQFVTFLMDKPLTLYYTIPTSTPKTYSILVDVIEVNKSEVEESGILSCSFQFQGLSRWKGTSVTQTGTTTLSITNNGHMPVGFSIVINGTNMENPYFTLEQDSELYGEAKFLGTFSKVTVNSEDGSQNVELQQSGSVLPNPLGYQDLSISNGSIYVTFVKLARGTSTLTVGVDSGTVTGFTVNFTPLYRSV